MADTKSNFQHFHPGQYLFREGEESREMYIIRSGRVRVIIAKENREVPITELGKNSFVGEMSFISGIPRTASVMALDEVYANVVGSEVFEQGSIGIPGWLHSIARALVDRIRRTTIMLGDYLAMGDVPAVEAAPPEAPSHSLELASDDIANKITLKGYLYKGSINAIKKAIKALLSRNEFKLSLDFSSVIDVDREGIDFIRELIGSKYASTGRVVFCNVHLIANKISQIEGITSLIEDHKMEIRNVVKDEFLIREGEIDQTMYVVRSGRFQVLRTSDGGEEIPLYVAEAGDVLGEMVLLKEGARSASVRALGSGSLFVVRARDFYHGVYNVPDWMMRVIRGLTERLRNTNEMLKAMKSSEEEEKQKEEADQEGKKPLWIRIDGARSERIVLKGYFIIENIAYFAAIVRLSMYKGVKTITVDLRQVEEMDRQSIRYLVNVYSVLKQGGGDLIILGNKKEIVWLSKHNEEAFSS